MTASQDSPPSLCKDTSRVEETLRTRYWSWSLFEEDSACTSLLAVLLRKLPHIDETSWTERFDFGGIYVNGLAASGDQRLPYPCKIEYYEPKFEIRDARDVFPAFESDFLLYVDDDIAVAYKPPKLPSMPAKEQRHYSLKSSLEKVLARTVHMPSRLDVSVRGLVVVSISQRAHAPLQRAFESRRVQKSYRLATTAPCSSAEFRVDLNIARDRTHPVLRTVSTSEGKSALTLFERSHTTYSDKHAITVLRAYPVSGRTHQIRVHAADAGIPILGDNFYGDTGADSLHLVSYELNIEHPISGKPMSFALPLTFCPAWVRPVEDHA
jgi:tRNA pseudouridine32 synthase/23S rRNA pseudouridine746 synthase